MPAALGTQTGGSVIRPSAFCGVVGYKPSFGEFTRSGIKLQCHNLDTLGILCRTVADLPPLRAAILAAPAPRHRSRRRRPRIGLCRTPAWDRADAATQALIERTAARLGAAGARVSEVAFAPEFADILEHHRRIFNFEAARNYAYEYEEHHELVSQVLRDTVLTPGRELPLAAYVEAIETAEAFRRHHGRHLRRGRRAADPERRRRGARGSRLDRRPELQFDLDPGLDALRDPAGRQRPRRTAARHPAGRPALPRRSDD